MEKVPLRLAWRVMKPLGHWHRRLLRWGGYRCHGAGVDRASVILLSYKRPGNIDKILSSVVLCDFVDEIIISNNNPEVALERYLHVSDPRIRVINQPQRRYPSVRLELSRETSSPYIIAIDDDLFPSPKQLRTLFEALLADPGVPHGFAGHVYPETPPRECRTRFGNNSAVEALIWIFAYTREHADNYFRLLERMGQINSELRYNEDVPLSFAGTGPARIHAVGRVWCCPSSCEEGVATFREGGFHEHRAALVGTLRELTGLRVDALPDLPR